MRRIHFILITFLIPILLATLFLWVFSFDMPLYIALSTDYRGPGSTRIGGFHSCGLYASHGEIGLIYHEATYGELEPGVPLAPAHPTQLIWDHSVSPDGGISRQELAYHMRYSRLGLSLYDGVEMGGGSEWVFRGFLLSNWLLVPLLGALLGLSLWCFRRSGRSLNDQLCPTCSYDIRVQLLGQAGQTCPECGTPVAPDSLR